MSSHLFMISRSEREINTIITLNKSKKSIYKYFVVLGICFIVLIIMLLSFAKMSDEYGKTYVEKTLLKTIEGYAIALQTELRVAEVACNSLGQFMVLENNQNKGNDIEFSEIIKENSDAYQVVICDYEGNGVYNNGEVSSIDMSTISYFSMIQKIGEPRYLQVESDEILGLESAIYIYPLVIQEEVKGFILAYISQHLVQNIITDQSLQANGFYAIIDNSGSVITHVGNTNSVFYAEKNFFNNLLNISENYASAEHIQKWSLSGLSGYEYLVHEDEEKIIFLTPLGVQNWYLVAGLDNHYIQQLGVAEWASIKEMLIYTSIAASVVVFLVIGIAIAEKRSRARKQRKLEDKADTDLLTGLNNKIATERKIKRYLSAMPNEKSILFIIDIDNFKKINDTKGHAFGDEVLKTLGEKLRLEYNINDILGRSGGDEFLILKKGLESEEGIQAEIDKLVRFFDAFRVGEYVKYKVTASMGVAVAPDDGREFDELYKAADQALYIAKRRGKKQLARFGEQV